MVAKVSKERQHAINLFKSVCDIPMYKPKQSIAYTFAGIFFLLGLMFFGKCAMVKRYRYLLVTLISLTMGGAFVARGLFAASVSLRTPFVAYNVLIELGAHLSILMNYILLLRLLDATVHRLGKSAIRMFRASALLVAAVFGSMACAGVVYVARKNSPRIRLGASLLRASAVSQAISSTVLLFLAYWAFYTCKEVRARRLWIGVVFAGGLLILARSLVRCVFDFSTSITLLRESEAAWYTLNPLLVLCCVILWIGASIPRRCDIKR